MKSRCNIDSKRKVYVPSLQEKYMHKPKPGKSSHLGVELVVAEVQGGVDWLKRLKVDIDFLLLAFLCHNGTTVNNQTIGWHWQERKVRGQQIRPGVYQVSLYRCINSVQPLDASIMNLYDMMYALTRYQRVTHTLLPCL